MMDAADYELRPGRMRAWLFSCACTHDRLAFRTCLQLEPELDEPQSVSAPTVAASISAVAARPCTAVLLQRTGCQ